MCTVWFVFLSFIVASLHAAENSVQSEVKGGNGWFEAHAYSIGAAVEAKYPGRGFELMEASHTPITILPGPLLASNLDVYLS
jgi:hypothetical protein